MPSQRAPVWDSSPHHEPVVATRKCLSLGPSLFIVLRKRRPPNNLQLMLPPLLVRGVIFLWRNVCRGYTILRHPWLHDRPAMMLRYETPSQREAYASLQFPPPTPPPGQRVLAIVPYRDNWSMTQVALESLATQNLGDLHLLVALVDNGSVEAATAVGTSSFVQRSTPSRQFRHLRYDIPFNYSRLNNQAVADCADFAPDHLLFVNNDIDLIDRNTVSALSAFLSAHPRCGSVGCTLVYPDRRVQHLFIHLGCKIAGAHPFKSLRLMPDDPWMRSPRPVGGCTAALLMVRRTDFSAVGSFEESLAHAVQDIDLALKLQQRGQVNWTLPYLVAVHHETQSRAAKIDWPEVEWLAARWQGFLTHNPYVSPRFSRWSERLVLSLGEGAYPWRLIAGRQD